MDFSAQPASPLSRIEHEQAQPPLSRLREIADEVDKADQPPGTRHAKTKRIFSRLAGRLRGELLLRAIWQWTDTICELEEVRASLEKDLQITGVRNAEPLKRNAGRLRANLHGVDLKPSWRCSFNPMPLNTPP